MAISRLQFAQAATGFSNSATVAPAFGSNVASGSLIVVIVRATAGTISTVADTRSTSYSLVDSNTSTDPCVWMYYGVTGSSGANTVTVTFGNSSNFRWGFAIEYSGQHASPLDTNDDQTGTGTSDLTLSAISTAGAGVIVVGGGQSGLATYTAGTDFTMIDGTISGEGFDYGGVQEYITSGTVSSYTAHMTSSTTDMYTLVLGAFLAGGSSPKPWLYQSHTHMA